MTITAKVYDTTGATLIATLSSSEQRQWVDQLNETGSGSLRIHKDDADLAAHPTAKNFYNIVRFSQAGTDRFAYVVESRDYPPAPTGEAGEQYWVLSGRGVLGLLEDAVVYPETPLTQTSPRDRTFGWMASSFDDTAWTAAVQIQKQDGTGTIVENNWVGFPTGWPDSSAYWIWSRAMVAGPSAPVGTSYFRKTFTLASTTSVAVFATCDNQFQLWLDDELLLSNDSFERGQSWPTTFRADRAGLVAGTHQIAVSGTNISGTSDNPAALLVSVIQTDTSNGIGNPPTVLLNTTSAWKALDYPTDPPGMSVGAILRVLIAEAQARSAGLLAGVTRGFTDANDSSSTAWTAIPTVAFPVGTSYLDVLRTLIEGYCDASMSPTLVLNAYNKFGLGVDRSATVTLAVGTDFEEETVKADGHLVNAVLIRDQTGAITEQTDATSLASNKRKEGYIEASTAPNASAARSIAVKLFKDFSVPAAEMTAKVTAASGPYTTWKPGDIITVPGPSGNVAATVVSIAVSEDDAGNEIYAVEAAHYDS